MKLGKCLLLSVVALIASGIAVGAATAQDENLPRVLYGAHAKETLAALNSRQGWMVVADRGEVQLTPDTPTVRAARYRFVTGYRTGETGNGEFYLEFLQFSESTPWIAEAYGLPVHSGPALPAVQRAVAAAKTIIEVAHDAERKIAQERDPVLYGHFRNVLVIQHDQYRAMYTFQALANLR